MLSDWEEKVALAIVGICLLCAATKALGLVLWLAATVLALNLWAELRWRP